METNHHFHHLLLLLFLLLLHITTTTTQTLPPSPPPSPSPSQSPSPLPSSSQLNNIIDALIGAGDFSIWVNILSMSNPTLLPVSATLFIPQDTTTSLNNGIPMVDPFLFPYHVVPQRLQFSELLQFRRNSRLPTLLPGKSISVTKNSAGNISLDGTPITHPDLFSTDNLAVHGVAAVLDYSLFGEGVPPPPPPPPPVPDNAMTQPFMTIGETSGVFWRSGAPAAGVGSLRCISIHVAAFVAFVLVLQELVLLAQ